MARTLNATSTPEGTFMRFEVRDGIHRISCTILAEALEAASGMAAPSTPLLRRRSFDRFRTLIDAAAKLKWEALPPGSVGSLVLTSEDLRSVPPQAGVPLFGSSARNLPRSACLIDGVSALANTSNGAVPLGPAACGREESR